MSDVVEWPILVIVRTIYRSTDGHSDCTLSSSDGIVGKLKAAGFANLPELEVVGGREGRGFSAGAIDAL